MAFWLKYIIDSGLEGSFARNLRVNLLLYKLRRENYYADRLDTKCDGRKCFLHAFIIYFYFQKP